MKSIHDRLLENEDIRSFVRLLRETNIWLHLESEGPHTVLAPGEKAFARLPRNLLDSLRQEKWRLREVLAYHIVLDRVRVEDFQDMETAMTLNGQMLQVRESNGNIMLDGSRIQEGDMPCRNGFIHILDGLMWPK